MLNETSALIKGIIKIADTFGFDYVKEHKDSPICRSVEKGILTMSYLFQNSEQRPDLEPDHLGWTVYATVKVDMNTGKAEMVDYILPDGTKMK